MNKPDHHVSDKKHVLALLEKDRVLSRFKAPLNAYWLMLFASLYNSANILQGLGSSYDARTAFLIIIREVSASAIGVYGLAKVFYLFIDSNTKKLLWYCLVIVAAFNFSYFIKFSEQMISSFLRVAGGHF